MNTDHQTAESIPPVHGQDPQPLALKRVSLTRANLKQLDQMGRRNTATETVPSSDSTNTTTSKAFGPRLGKNGVLHYRECNGPLDLTKVRDALEGDQESAPCTPKEFHYYQQQMHVGHTENKTQSRFWTKLAKDCYREEGQDHILTAKGDGCVTERAHNALDYTDYFNHAWSQLDNQITAGISAAKPDIIEAFRAKSFPKNLDDLLPELFPAGSPDFVMPSFAVELKNDQVGLLVADLQCAYDGALMVHAAMKAHEYMYGSSASALDSFWNKTKAITIAFDGRDLHIFAHFAALNPDWEGEDDEDHRVLFHQYVLKQIMIISDFEAFRKGQQLIQNAQDLGYELNADLRRQLQEHRRRTKVKAQADTYATLEAAESAESAARQAPLSPLSNGPGTTLKTRTEESSEVGEPATKKAKINA